MIKTVIKNSLILAWTAVGAYVGLAGYFGAKLFEKTSAAILSGETNYLTYGGLSFRTKQDLADYLLDETASRWFSWLPDIPAELMPILACCAWGVFGGALRLLHQAISDIGNSQANLLAWRHVLLIPVLGAGVAIGVYLLAFLLPTVLTVNPHTMRAETLVALSLVSGIGCEQVYKWVQSQIRKLTS